MRWPVAGVWLWLAWTALVVASVFIIPDDRLTVGPVPLTGLPFWSEAAASALRAAAAAATVLLAGWALGRPLVSRLGVRWTTSERAQMQLASGCSLLACVSLAIAAAGLYTPTTVRTITMAAALLGIALLIQAGVPLRVAVPRNRLDRAALVVAAVACAGALVGALAPEIEYDALWYHLWLPQRWLAAGRPVDIVEEYISLYPLGWELLYGAAMTMGGVPAAKLLHWICLPLIGLATAMLTREIAPRASALLAAALAIVVPTMLWEATTAYVDLALAWYLTLATFAVVRFARGGERQWLVAGAVVLGGALAIKHLALVALAILAAAVLAAEYRRGAWARALTAAGMFVAIALVLPSPWYLRAYLASGNPVFPDLYGIFGASPETRWSEVTEQGLRAFRAHFGRPRTLGNLLTLPWDVTTHAARYGGSLGPLLLVLLPAALPALRTSRALTALGAGVLAYLAVWASPVSSFQMRFLIPIVPPIAVLAAAGAAQLRAAGGGAVSCAIIGLLLIMNLPPFVMWHEGDRVGDTGWLTHVTRGLPWAVVLGGERPRDYVERTVPSVGAWRFVDTHLPADVRVLTFSGGDHLYSSRSRVWSESTLGSSATWHAPSGSEPAVLAVAKQLGITHVLFDRGRPDRAAIEQLAIGSATMRACCLSKLYDDGRFTVYEVHSPPIPATAAARGTR